MNLDLLNYRVYGEKTREALLIVHGLFGSLDNWMSLAKLWSTSYYVILIDVRNHGKSFHSDDMRFESMAEDILRVMKQEDIENIHLMGHSMGGKIAMDFAAQYADQISSLIIVDVAPYVYSPHHGEVFEMLDQIDLGQWSSRGDIELEIRKFVHSEAVVQFMVKNVRRNEDTLQFEWKFNYPVLKREYRYLIQRIPPQGYEGRVLFIGGVNSHYITKETSELMVDLYPNFELEYVEKAGHWVHADNPSDFYKKVSHFLANAK